jgi:hypothetical protein
MAANSVLRPMPDDYRAVLTQADHYGTARLQTDCLPAELAHRWQEHWLNFPAGD